MPRPSGRGGSFVVHPDWNASNRPAATSVLIDACTQVRPGTGPGAFDPATGDVTGPTPMTIATDLACYVQVVQAQASTSDVAEEMVTQQEYAVQLPWAHADVEVHDRLTFTATQDPRLTGRTVRVIGVVTVTAQWTRVLRAVDNETELP